MRPSQCFRASTSIRCQTRNKRGGEGCKPNVLREPWLPETDEKGAAEDRGGVKRRRIVGQTRTGPHGGLPKRVKPQRKLENPDHGKISAVDHGDGASGAERPVQSRGDWQKNYGQQEGETREDGGAIALPHHAQELLIAAPEHCGRGKAQEQSDKIRPGASELRAKLQVSERRLRQVHVESEQCHGDGEDSVAQCRQSIDAGGRVAHRWRV